MDEWMSREAREKGDVCVLGCERKDEGNGRVVVSAGRSLGMADSRNEHFTFVAHSYGATRDGNVLTLTVPAQLPDQCHQCRRSPTPPLMLELPWPCAAAAERLQCLGMLQ